MFHFCWHIFQFQYVLNCTLQVKKYSAQHLVKF
jgi:hypothetical protein